MRRSGRSWSRTWLKCLAGRGVQLCAVAPAVLVALTPRSPLASEAGRAELEFFVGTWTLLGYETSYEEVCRWLPGGGFVVCQGEDRSEEPSASLSVFGYSQSDSLYTYHGFGSSGGQRSLRGTLEDGVWRFFGQSDRGPLYPRWQVTITPTPAGFHFREEVSVRGGPWVESVVLEFLRKSDGRPGTGR